MTSARRTLLHVFPSFEVGGAQSRFVQLANHFGERYRHVIVAMDGRTTATQRLFPASDAVVLPLSAGRLQALPKLTRLRRVLRDLRPDLLVTSNWGSIDWAIVNRLEGIPHLHMEDGFGTDETKHQLRRRVWTRRVVLRRSTVMVPSLTLFKIAGDIWKLPRHTLVHVPNGVNCARFVREPDAVLAARFGIRSDVPVIGTISGLRSEKNLERLLDAFSIVVRSRPAQLVIVGDGPERGAMERATETHGLSGSVVFTGSSPMPERLLPMFSVFALSSDTEQMPLAILEAMAASRAIAATDVGDIGEMVAPPNREFVVPRCAHSLAKAILELLANPARAKEIGRTNRERAVAHYDEATMFEAYRRLYDGDITSRSERYSEGALSPPNPFEGRPIGSS